MDGVNSLGVKSFEVSIWFRPSSLHSVHGISYYNLGYIKSNARKLLFHIFLNFQQNERDKAEYEKHYEKNFIAKIKHDYDLILSLGYPLS